jgi:hypothetical protein
MQTKPTFTFFPLHDNCMVKLLQPRGSVPPSCDKRIVEISNSVWTQLDNNEWIYFVPNSESITVLCVDKHPVDVIVSGIGNLAIGADCKGFGKSALFQPHSITNMATEGFRSDFLSKVHLEYDCCEELNVKLNISTIHLNTSYKHTVSHLDDLKIASRRVSEVENMIKEQEWKRLHTASHGTYSILVYICFLLIILYIFYKMYFCLKGKASCVKAVTDTSGSGNVVTIKIHTSSEGLAMAQEHVRLRDIKPPTHQAKPPTHQAKPPTPDAKPPTPEAKPRRSRRLRAAKSCF